MISYDSYEKNPKIVLKSLRRVAYVGWDVAEASLGRLYLCSRRIRTGVAAAPDSWSIGSLHDNVQCPEKIIGAGINGVGANIKNQHIIIDCKVNSGTI